MLREISTENLMDLLKPKTHVYCKVSNLKVGDYVRWFTQDTEILSIDINGDSYDITLSDPLNGDLRKFKYPKDEELLLRKFCIN